MQKIKHIAVIGSGNAGQFFLQKLRDKGLKVEGFARRSTAEFRSLESYHPIAHTFDLTLLCTSDNAIAEVSANLPVVKGILAHVSGMEELMAIDSKHPHPAVFYPLMSLTSETPPSIEKIPFCLESNEEWVTQALAELCAQLGANSHIINTSKRAYLHLAAVVSQNFSNFLIGKAKTILERQEIDFNLILPLLQQSMERLKFRDPREVQTGPAIRGDNNTMQKHIQLLEDEELKEIYQLLSNNIRRENDKEL